MSLVAHKCLNKRTALHSSQTQELSASRIPPQGSTAFRRINKSEGFVIDSETFGFERRNWLPFHTSHFSYGNLHSNRIRLSKTAAVALSTHHIFHMATST